MLNHISKSVTPVILFSFLVLSWGYLLCSPDQGSSQFPKSAVDKDVKEKTAKPSASSGKPDGKKPDQEIKIFGFIDRNHDGKNDLFQDTNGDGINDVTGNPYPHRFKFVDKNGDGINDIFVDRDGDGVNDLDGRFLDMDGDGSCDNIVDTNSDLINDITGLRYTRNSLRGYKFGFIKEERMNMMRNFIDENADGIPDSREHPGMKSPMRGDHFIDRDGDGIDDRRERMQRHKKMMRGGGK